MSESQSLALWPLKNKSRLLCAHGLHSLPALEMQAGHSEISFSPGINFSLFSGFYCAHGPCKALIPAKSVILETQVSSPCLLSPVPTGLLLAQSPPLFSAYPFLPLTSGHPPHAGCSASDYLLNAGLLGVQGQVPEVAQGDLSACPLSWRPLCLSGPCP